MQGKKKKIIEFKTASCKEVPQDPVAAEGSVAAKSPPGGGSLLDQGRWLRLLIYLMAAFFLFWGLDKPDFWDDEAHVAILARNHVETGRLSGWDGRNFLPDKSGVLGFHPDHTAKFWQLDAIVTAVTFRMFGVSVWSARIPFALCGFLSIFVFEAWLRERWPGLTWGKLYALAGLVGSVSFLMFCRSCRYYALASLAVVTVLWAWERLGKGGGWIPATVMAVAASVLCYSSAFLCLAMGMAMGLWILLFDRHKFGIRMVCWLALSALLFAVLSVPYLVQVVVPAFIEVSASKVGSGFQTSKSMADQLRLLVMNFRGLDDINGLPWLLALIAPAAFWLSKHWKRSEETDVLCHCALESAVLLALCVIFLSLFSPQPVGGAELADVRYLSPFIPLAVLVVSTALALVHGMKAWGAGTLLILWTSTNLLSLEPLEKGFRWLLPNYVLEMVHPPKVAVTRVAEYLRDHARKDQTLAVVPTFMAKPVTFLLGDRMFLVGIFPSASLENPERYRALRPDLLAEHASPDWIIAFGSHHMLSTVLSYYLRGSEDAGTKGYAVEKIFDVYWEQVHRPELPWHLFVPRGDFDRKTEAVYLFRKNTADLRP